MHIEARDVRRGWDRKLEYVLRIPILARRDRAIRVRRNELKSASYEDVFLYKYANLEEKHLVTH